jgi:hypothetical protein
LVKCDYGKIGDGIQNMRGARPGEILRPTDKIL